MRNKLERYFARTAPLSVGITVCAITACCGYPTSLNRIPTAETVGSGSLLLEVTNCGYPRLLTTESVSGILTQFGIGERLEFGIDRYETDDTIETYFNVKARLIDENNRQPSLSVGLMDLRRGCTPTSYAVASKQVGNMRTHLGVIRGSYAHGIMAGIEMDITDHWWFAIDYLPGMDNYLRLGISCDVGSGASILATFGIPNSRGGRAELSITFSTTLSTGK